MNSVQISLSREVRLGWPSGCAMCGSPAASEATASVSTSEEFQYLLVIAKWTHKTLSLSYPVCQRHQLLCNVLDRPARWGFINAAVNFLWIPGLVWIGLSIVVGLSLGKEVAGPFIVFSGWVVFGAMFLFYLSARFLKPVRLSGLHKGVLVISIRNHDYFQQFKAINSATID